MAKINGDSRIKLNTRMTKESRLLILLLIVNLVHLGLYIIQIYK